jgi:hypothetical protein
MPVPLVSIYLIRNIFACYFSSYNIFECLLGASEPRNMAYMNRLGIWGEGTPFREFSDFIQAVERR